MIICKAISTRRSSNSNIWQCGHRQASTISEITTHAHIASACRCFCLLVSDDRLINRNSIRCVHSTHMHDICLSVHTFLGSSKRLSRSVNTIFANKAYSRCAIFVLYCMAVLCTSWTMSWHAVCSVASGRRQDRRGCAEGA